MDVGIVCSKVRIPFKPDSTPSLQDAMSRPGRWRLKQRALTFAIRDHVARTTRLWEGQNNSSIVFRERGAAAALLHPNTTYSERMPRVEGSCSRCSNQIAQIEDCEKLLCTWRACGRCRGSGGMHTSCKIPYSIASAYLSAREPFQTDLRPSPRLRPEK